MFPGTCADLPGVVPLVVMISVAIAGRFVIQPGRPSTQLNHMRPVLVQMIDPPCEGQLPPIHPLIIFRGRKVTDRPERQSFLSTFMMCIGMQPVACLPQPPTSSRGRSPASIGPQNLDASGC